MAFTKEQAIRTLCLTQRHTAMKRLRNTSLLALAAVLGTTLMLPSSGFADHNIPNIPPQFDAGAISTHNMRMIQLQRTQPWVTRPIYNSDINSQLNQPVIEIPDPTLRGTILQKSPSQTEPPAAQP